MNLKINQSICWICGKEKAFNTHHVIPQHLNSVNNIEIPSCKLCHDKINKIDKGAVTAYLYKILKLLEQNRTAVYCIKGVIEKELKTIETAQEKEEPKNG